MIASKQDIHAGLRIPKYLVEALDVEARKNGRSRNTEMYMRLHASAEKDGLIEKAPSAANG